MKENRLKTIFVATVIAALLVIIITICIIFIPSRPCLAIKAVQNLTTVQFNDTLLATWSQPVGHGNCPMTYRVQLSNGADLIREGFTMLPTFHFLNVSFAPCSPNTVSVQAMSSSRFGGDIIGDTNSFNHFGNIGPVTNLEVLLQESNALTASWDPPMDSELCTLSYEVKLNAEGEVFTTSNNAFTFEQIDSRPCETNTVIVTPLGVEDDARRLRGQEKTRAHFELGSVEDFQLERGGETLLTSWKAPNHTQDCQLSYEVTLTFQGEVRAQVVTQFLHHNFLIEDMRPCSLSNVTITPIATVEDEAEEVRGLEIHRVHIEGLGPVVNLEITQQANGLLVGWDPPSTSDLCSNISYEVVLQTRDEIIQESHIILENQVLLAEANLDPCVTNIVILTPMASINDGETVVTGQAVDCRHFGDVGAVENLVVTQEGEGLVLNWTPPAVREECPMIYKVNMWYSEDDVTTGLTDKLTYVFENAGLKPCMTSQVSVIPIVRKDLHESEGKEARGRYFGDVGPITNFELTLNDDDQLVARWNAPVESELCQLSYEMLLESTEEVTSKVFAAQNYLEHVLTGADLRPCAVNNVTLTPIAIVEGGGLKRGLQDTRSYFAGIGPAENLEISHDKGGLTVDWARPAQSELCRVSYAVTLSFGEVVMERIQTDLEGHTFVEANLQSCVENRVSVIPFGSSQGQETEGPEVSRGHFADLGPVVNFEVTQRSNGLYASWDAPKSSDLCVDLSYEVVLKSSDESVVENHVVPENALLLEGASLEPCAINTVEVNPTAKTSDGGLTVTGQGVAVLHLADVGPVENLVIVRAEEGLMVNWGPPTVSEDCPLTYEVRLLYDGEVLETVVTDALGQVFENVDLRPCVVSEVAVVPLVDLYERRGEEVRARYVGEIGSVTDFELALNDNNQLTASWNAPVATERCALSYEVSREAGGAAARRVFSQGRGHFEHVFTDADVRPCVLHAVKITPVAVVDGGDSVRGAEDLRTYFTELGPVEKLEVTQQPNGLFATWDPPGESEACIDVSYEVVLKTDDETVVESGVVLENGYNFEEADLEPCVVNLITVTPTAKISDGETTVAGEEATSLHVADIGPVEDLVVVQTAENGLAVNWAPPMVVGSCTLTYEVNLWYNEEVAETTTTDGLEHVFETTVVRPCMVVEVSVTPLVDLYEKQGEEIRNRHVGEIGSVTNFELTLDDTNQLTARWNAPVHSDLCDLSYEILLDSGDPPAAPHRVFNGDRLEHVFTEANLRPCILNTVTLTPTADVEGDSVRGAEDLRAFFTGLGPVANLQVTQQPNGLFATWDTPGESEACIDISYEVVLKTYDEIVLENLVVLANEHSFEGANLEPCSVNIITVTPTAKISDGETVVKGDEGTVVYFADIGPVEDLVLVQAEGGLAVNWAPPTVVENCPMTYEVKLLHDDEIVEADVTGASEHVFENADLTPCVVTEVYVTPLVDLYERRGEELRKRHVGEIGAVTNFELTLNDHNRLTARWDAPVATERCELTYEVLLHPAARQVFEDRYFEHVLTEADLRPCVLNTVTVTPIANVEGDSVRGAEDFRRYFTGLGPVANFEVTQQPDGLFASWAPPGESESCIDLFYELVLKTDDDVILESRAVVENEYNFEEGNLEPCALSIITITPKAKLTDGEYIVKGEDVTDVHIADIGSVQNLGIAQTEESLEVNWEAPTVSENCPLTFEVNLWYNGDVAETATTDNLGYVFENADVRPCVINEVSVVPIARKELQESKGEETRGRHIGEIGSVANFELLTLDDDNQLIARWNAPINSELCEMTYEISLESTEEEQAPQIFTQTQLEHVFSEVNPRPCVAYTVTITPVAIFEGDHLLRGPQDTLAHVEDIGPVEDLEVNQSGESLLVTWGRPGRSELCQMSYEVTLSLGEEVSDHIQIDVEGHIFGRANLAPCTENSVSVIPIGRNQELTTEGPETSQPHFAAVGPVQNLIFQAEPFGISWIEPTNSDACVLSYRIQIDSDDEESNIVSENFYPLEDIPCHQYTATVTPLVQEGQSGPPQTQTHQVPSVTEIGSVQNLRFSENAFEWDPPMDTGECDVKYELRVTINGESTVVTTEERVFEVLSLCTAASIVITASVEDVIGEPVDLEVEVPLLSLGPVVNLEFRSDRVRWERPSDSGACPIVYKITHTSGSDTTEATLPQSQNYFLIDLKYCSHHEVSVYAFHEESSVAGDPRSIRKTIALPNDPAAIGRVRGLAFISEVLVEWQPPGSIDTELCSVVYSVTLDRGFDMKTVSQEETHFDIPEVPCSNNVLSVFPIVNGVLGQVAEISSVQSENVMIEKAPVLISSTADSTFVSTIWRAPGKEINACKITNFTVELVLDEARRLVKPVTDNDERIISLEVSDLVPDTEYTMRTGIHIHEFPIHGTLSEAFTFRTEPAVSEAETRDFKKRDNDPAHLNNKGPFAILAGP